ncbi:MAG TPA: 4-(cytidine 5'-diphospho)-2-C-methyl-D-erythritol kinase [Candidatus Latescibacteria bacterium]|nr:4-(cytidine 5'-diphospho)-2-C-methyl-D-erythritol kinase [Candidatus Latescibacterota bacterium]
MTVKSFAKINLGLEIVGKRADGYHDIRTLFQTITLADELHLEPAPAGVIDITGDDPAVAWDETNLVHRAARLLKEISGTDHGARILVKKSIPAGRGLGGGSSNAAAALLGLNRMWDLGLDRPGLAGLARRLGADVPFFLHGGLCLGEDIGDRLTRLPDLAPIPCLLVFPPFPIPTASIYAGIGPSLTSDGKVSKIMRFLETGDFGLLENDLEHVILRAYPELERWKKFFGERGAILCQVSGSGSAVYGIFADAESALEAQKRLPGTAAARLAATLPREGYWAQLGAGA